MIPRFYGDDRSAGAYEALAMRTFVKDQVRRETRLFHTKWFDYRFWHFAKATYYLAHCYRKACSDFVDLTKGDNHGPVGDPFGVQDVFASREISGLLALRQALDEHGMRYEWALKVIIHRSSDRGWRLMPRPNQLYGEETIFDLVQAWQEECRARLQLPDDQRLQANARPGSLQPSYARWALDQAKARATPGMEWMPLSTLLRAGVVSASQARSCFPEPQVAQALGVSGVSQR